jgi:hypothetical protein
VVRQWGRASSNGFHLPDPIVSVPTGSTGPAFWERSGHRAGPQVLFLVPSFAPAKEGTACAAWSAYNNILINLLHIGWGTDKNSFPYMFIHFVDQAGGAFIAVVGGRFNLIGHGSALLPIPE